MFVDSNVAMYLVGADHPNKEAARLLIESAIVHQENVHVAAMEAADVRRLASFDTAFDSWPGLERLP